MRKILFFFVVMFLVSFSSVHAEGGGGNYSKDKACKLADGMWGYNIQITNYPGYNTFVKNFVKEKGMLYYVVNATPIEGDGKGETFLWSWNCKTKKPQQLTSEISDLYLTEMNTNTAEIDHIDKAYIIVRYKVQGNYCSSFKFIADPHSKISYKDASECTGYSPVTKYIHVMINRKTNVKAILEFTGKEQGMSSPFSGYYQLLSTLQEKYDSFSCYLPDEYYTNKKYGSDDFKLNEYNNIPKGSVCTYSEKTPYIIDIRPSGKYTLFRLSYGNAGLWGDQINVRVDLPTRTIVR